MRLTAYTDYTLRTLIYLALHRERLVTIQEIAEFHDISKNHLTKIVHQLGMSEMVDVVRSTESDFYMAECFDPANNTCSYAEACRLKGVLNSATNAYLAVLDGVSLEDLISKNKMFSKVQIHTKK